MTRLANQMKMGYFALPESLLPCLASYVSAPAGGRLLDPCAGEGVALAHLAAAWQLDAYGVELNEERAPIAAAALAALDTGNRPNQGPVGSRLLHEDARHFVCKPGSFNIIYANPPYDHDDEDGRLEYVWLKRCRELLQPAGLLLFVVPQHMLGRRQVARYLASWFRELTIHRFPDGEYERFGQIVLFGLRRARAGAPDAAQLSWLKGLAGAGSQLAPLTHQAAPCYTLPPVTLPGKAFVFRSRFVDPTAAQAEANVVGVRQTTGWKRQLAPAEAPTEPIRPIMPLKIGHLAALIAAGFLNSRLIGAGDNRLLIKGTSYRDSQVETHQEEADGQLRQVTTETQHYVTRINTLSPLGEVTALDGAALKAFLETHLADLTRHVTSAYPPTYHFHYAESPYRPVIDRLGLSRAIPHLNHRGLFMAQKHVVAALAAHLETHQEAILVGEMGTGKTTVGAAVAACRGAGRSLVMCPPHLVAKWAREAEVVWPEVETMVLTTVADVAAWFGRATIADDGTARPQLAILSHSRAKLNSGWQPAADAWSPTEHSLARFRPAVAAREETRWQALQAELANTPDVERPHHLQQQLAALADERQRGWPQAVRQAVSRYLARRGVRCPHCGQIVVDKEGIPLDLTTLQQLKKRRFCNLCRRSLYQFDRRRTQKQAPGSFRVYAERERQIRRALASTTPWTEAVLRPGYFPEPAGYARYPLAQYILDRHAGQIDLLIVDEVHELKGADSDQGYAFHTLASASRKILALTGTLFGGKSSTLFHLLYRLAPALRRAFTDEEAEGQSRIQQAAWVEQYGVRQIIETQKVEAVSGRLSGKTRSAVSVREIPGANPAMMVWLLNRCVFLSLRDLGFALPDYEEIPVPVAPAADMLASYRALKETIETAMNERLVRGDRSLLGAYLQACLSWPDSTYRPEVVIDPKTRDREQYGIQPLVVAAAAGLDADPDRIFPKEQAILSQLQAEKAAGRPCVLFCQQTNTRDITPRWLKLLADHGLRAAVLRCAPDKRESWIARQVERGIDVLITHPRSVATGLDLLDFPTLIFMGIEYSSYVVAQASRRSWRIGQDRPVRVYFYYYEQTLQAEAIQLIAAKIAANTQVNGDVIADNSLADLAAASASIQGELAKIALGQEETAQADLTALFARANQMQSDANLFLGYDETVLVEKETVVVANRSVSTGGTIPAQLPEPGLGKHPDLRAATGRQTSLFERLF